MCYVDRLKALYIGLWRVFATLIMCYVDRLKALYIGLEKGFRHTNNILLSWFPPLNYLGFKRGMSRGAKKSGREYEVSVSLSKKISRIHCAEGSRDFWSVAKAQASIS